ncbi:zinc finger, CCHC-type containing protein [Tanacetum coccineum]
MASNFSKLDKFEGLDFRRWQKKMHFLLSSMSVVYVLTTPIPEDEGDNPTVEQVRKRAKWENDDYVCRGLILKDFKHTLKHKKEELTLVELSSHLRIEESLRVPNKKNRITPYELWTKKKPNMNYLRVWGCKAVVRLPDQKMKTLGERGIECIFVGYAEHSKAFRFYIIEPNDLVLINSIIESNDVIFDENRFLSVPRPSLRIPNETEYICGSVVPEEATKEVVQQLEPKLRKSKRNRTPKDFGPQFQLYLIEGTMDEVSDQHFDSYNIYELDMDTWLVYCQEFLCV